MLEGTQHSAQAEALTGVRSYREAHAGAIIDELVALTSIPNNVYITRDIQNNAAALQRMMERRGIRVELLPTASGRPAVFGELAVPGATTTLLFYGHYDGVPVEPEAWHSPPYQAVLRSHLPGGADPDWSTIPFPADGQFAPEWRIFGRSIADSKNAIVAILSALDALRAQGLMPGVHLKFLFDGEEEQESPGLPACLTAHRDKLRADLMISASGETHQSGLPTLAFGVRGVLMFELTVYTALADLHSGHFGNFAPSAVLGLAQLLNSLKHADGTVAVAGFYDDVAPLSVSERQAILTVPQIEAGLRAQFGIARSEIDGKLLQELINLPTLNIRGIKSGFVGSEARNIVPRLATADFDARLVKGMDPDRICAKIIAHIEQHGWHVLDHEPDQDELLAHPRCVKFVKHAGFPAARTPLDSPLAMRVVRAVTRAVPEPLVLMPTEGGSLPLYLFEQIGIPFVCLPTSNFDCNQHTSDENLHLKYFFQGIDTFASVMLWV